MGLIIIIKALMPTAVSSSAVNKPPQYWHFSEFFCESLELNPWLLGPEAWTLTTVLCCSLYKWPVKIRQCYSMVSFCVIFSCFWKLDLEKFPGCSNFKQTNRKRIIWEKTFLSWKKLMKRILNNLLLLFQTWQCRVSFTRNRSHKIFFCIENQPIRMA